MTRRAVFLDRDGTLVEHYDYITDPSQLALLPNAAKALDRLKARGFALVLITNQSAIARGMITEARLDAIHQRLKALLAEQGAYLDAIYFCPFHPEAAIPRYRRESDHRKPAPGMLLQAAADLHLDLQNSWMVGDDDRDIEAGRNAHCRTILIDSHATSVLVHRGQATPDYRAVNLLEAANLIIRYMGRPEPEPQPQPDPELLPEPEPQPESQPEPLLEPAVAEPEEPIPHAAAEPEPDPDPVPQPEPEHDPARATDPEPDPEPEPDPLPKPEPPLQRPLPEREIRRREIARHRRHPGSEPKEPAPGEHDSTQTLLTQILRELRNLNRQQSFAEFSIAKLFAGVVQMLVVLCLALALYYMLRPLPEPATAHNWLLAGIIFQILTLTLIALHRQQ